LTVSQVAASSLALGCGGVDELGSGVCMGPAPTGSVVATGAESLEVNTAMRVIGTTKPIYVVRDGQGFMALNATCTHMHCEAVYVAASADYECGCHGSRYNIDGSVLRGPTQRPLAHVFICRNSAGLLVVQPDHTLSGNSGRIQ
jgi:Rieske Fe-S protein